MVEVCEAGDCIDSQGTKASHQTVIKLTGKDGFEFFVDPSQITHFGIERGQDVLFVVIEGKEWRVTEYVEGQYRMLKEILLPPQRKPPQFEVRGGKDDTVPDSSA